MKLYVDAIAGADAASGSLSNPFKTLTYAFSQAQSETVIEVAPGTYNIAHGEVFPLLMPAGVTLVGQEADREQGVNLIGGGSYTCGNGKTENVTIVMGNDSKIQGITVTNHQLQGIAIWIDSVYCTVTHCRLVQSQQDGIFVTRTAIVEIVDNIFTENGGHGIVLQDNAKGEIRNNQLINSGYGIKVQGEAAPFIENNQIQQNRTGVVLAGNSKPVLRNNKIENNDSEGLAVIAQGQPDLGQSQDPGLNILRDNGIYDLQNASPLQLLSVGNQINPSRVQGNVLFGVSQVDLRMPIPTSKSPFPDIIGHWAEAFILSLIHLKIISGFPDGTFRPDESLTRAQYAVLLAHAFDLKPIREATPFTDIPDDFWAKEVIQTANKAGFLVGFPDNSFRPHQNLTRIQAILALVKGLQLSGGLSEILTIYRDRDSIPSYAVDAIATATVEEMIVNYPDTTLLAPQRQITRAEVAAIICQTLVSQHRTDRINSPYIVWVKTQTIQASIQ